MYGQVPDQPGRQEPQFGPPPPQGPPEPPRSRRPPWWIVAAIGVGVLLVVSLVGFVLLERRPSTVSGPVKAGQCVGTRFEMGPGNAVPVVRVHCKDVLAKAKIVKMTREGRRSSFEPNAGPAPDCPDGADGAARVSAKAGDAHYWESCVRNLKGPHPGDPGAGGAMISNGDCVGSAASGSGREKPCADTDWYGKVIARAASATSCPSPRTLETLTLQSFSGGSIQRPVLCLGQGGAVVGTGDCVEDPSFAFAGPKKAACGSGKAIAKVVALPARPITWRARTHTCR
jgi:hypothetical protein